MSDGAAEEGTPNDRARLEQLVGQRTEELQAQIAERQLAEAEILRLRRRDKLILDTAGEGIAMLGPDGAIRYVNPAGAQMLGWAVEDLLGQRLHEAAHYRRSDGTPFPREECPHCGPHRETDHHNSEEVLWRKSGQAIPVSCTSTLIQEEDGPGGSVVIFEDITKRKEAEEALRQQAEELRRSNAELEQFAYVISHDLQEPLRKIQAFGGRLEAKCHDTVPEQGRDYLERMIDAAERMRNMINDVLAYSRITTRGHDFVPVDLHQIAVEALTSLEVRVQRAGAAVQLESLPTIEADPVQMQQLLQNLIANSLKFCKPDVAPVIRISGQLIDGRNPAVGRAQARDTVCQLLVEDNGIGFDEKYLGRIFSVFQRLHTREEYEGTGIGLAICRKIVERHGGHLTARSTPGEGAKFIVTLPARELED